MKDFGEIFIGLLFVIGICLIIIGDSGQATASY
jgi:hypothetical protein